MSYIREQLENDISLEYGIGHFLMKEGFKRGTGAIGEGSMYYVVSGNCYTVWFAVGNDFISLYAEYECGGCVGETEYHFEEGDFDSFIEAYKDSIEWAKHFL